ncbi:MAG: alpha/beta hydrolase, partial [Desulfobacterales bacterium]|nr:alpha/beta hydrolase [Desulfobacterales bacterium]
DKAHRTYTIFPGERLRMGVASLGIGDVDASWLEIFNLTTSSDDKDRPALVLNHLDEMAVLPLDGYGDENLDLSGGQNFFNAVNGLLARVPDKNLTVYVHGANSTIYRASAQAAQYRHFTGRNSAVLVFLWPSAENLLKYRMDVRHAKKSTPAFAGLIALLSKHTRAKKINILAYSAGAQIVSPGLAHLGREAREGGGEGNLRLGEIYFAAADVGLDVFVEHLQAYLPLAERVTLTINMRDTVLDLAEQHHRVSRAGRPKGKDLGPEARQWIREASNTPGFEIIGVDSETVSGLPSGSHDFWYAHPWVSSDMMLQFLFSPGPGERGLEENRNENGVRYWTFPPDYPSRIIDILNRAQKGK